jgi:hypothetical protein
MPSFKIELPKLPMGTMLLEPVTAGMDISGASRKGEMPVLVSLNGIGLAVVFDPNMAQVLGRHFHMVEQLRLVLEAGAKVFGPDAPEPGAGAEEAIRDLIAKVQAADGFLGEETGYLTNWLNTMKGMGVWKGPKDGPVH